MLQTQYTTKDLKNLIEFELFQHNLADDYEPSGVAVAGPYMTPCYKCGRRATDYVLVKGEKRGICPAC